MTKPTVHVPPQFPKKSPTKIAFIGEAPSYEEIEQGAPLVGPSGKVFNQLLRTAGLDRYEFMVTNVFDQQLPDNDVKHWCTDLKTARSEGLTDLPPIGSAGFLRAEHRWHLTRLREELELARPTVLVPLGGTALWALLGTVQIGQYRGTITAAKHILPGAKMIPTFHPMFVMKQWQYFPVVVGDFLKANSEAERGPKIIHPKRELLIEPTLQDVRDYVPKLLASDLLSVDIETGWGQVTCIGFAPDAEHAICIPFVDLRKPSRSYWTVEEELEIWEIVRTVMESPTPKLGQNFGGYDAFWIIDRMRMEPRNYLHDTRLIHHALYPELPKSLEFMAASYTQQGAWKLWGHSAQNTKRDD